MLVQVADDIPGIREVNEALNRHAEVIAWPAAIVGLIGTLALIAGIAWPSGRTRPPRRGDQVSSFRLADMKHALLDGTLRTSKLWQKRSLLFAGAMALVLGVFALVFALSPPAVVKLLIGPA